MRPTAVVRILFAVLALAAVAAPSGAADLTSTADAIDLPRVGPRVVLDGPISLPSGELRPSAGATVHRLGADDDPCGLVVFGKATFVHRVTDPYSVPVAARNLDRAAGGLRVVERDGGLEITEQVDGAVLWSFDLDLPAADAGAAATAPPFPDWAADWLDHSFVERPSLRLLAHRGLGAPSALVALLRGGGERLRLVRDPAISGTERLTRIDRERVSLHPAFKGVWWAQELTAAPISRQWFERFPAAAVAVATSLDVTHESGDLASVRSTTTIRATSDGVGVWWTDLMSEVILPSSVEEVHVRSVLVGGREADFLHRDDQLLVFLPQPLAQGATAEVEVRLDGPLAHRWEGNSYWILGTGAWYPQPPLNGELATMELTVRVPEGQVPIASGAEVERTTSGGTTKLVTRLDAPSQFPVVAVGKYLVVEETRDGVTCRVASYGIDKKTGAEKLLGNFFAAREFYENLFDVPYPFPEVTLVEVDSWGWGQAPPGVVFLTREAFATYTQSSIGRAASQDLNLRFLHEIAHAWWGHVAKMDSAEEQWVTESFAEYAAGLALRAMYGGKKGDKAFDDLVDRWSGLPKRVDRGASIYLANHLAGEGSRDREARTLLLYDKGAAVLHAMRQELGRRAGSTEAGDRAFLSFLRSVLKNFRFQWAHTRHMATILGQISGDDWQPWFDRYVYGVEMPDLDG